MKSTRPMKGKGKGKMTKFKCPEQETKFVTTTSKRPVVGGTVVKFDGLTAMPIFKWLNGVKLDKYCTLDEPIYSDLVRYFYNNWTEKQHVDDGYDFQTFVNGIEIDVDEQVIIDALDFEHDQFDYNKYANFCAVSKGEKVGNWVYPDCARQFALSNKVGDLNPYVRILHKIVIECLVPRGGNLTTMTVTDQCIMWHIVSHHQINMPYLILNHMRHIATSGGNMGLSFGMIITRILKGWGVSLTGEVSQPPELLSAGRLAFMKMKFVESEQVWKMTKTNKKLDDFPLLPGGRTPMNLENPLSTPYGGVSIGEAGTSTTQSTEDVEHCSEDEMPEGPLDRPATYGDVILMHKKFNKRLKKIEQFMKDAANRKE